MSLSSASKRPSKVRALNTRARALIITAISCLWAPFTVMPPCVRVNVCMFVSDWSSILRLDSGHKQARKELAATKKVC